MQVQNQNSMQQGKSTKMSASMDICITNCQECYKICIRTINLCLQMGGVHAEAEHIKIMQDCAQICATSVEFMIRESNFHNLTCAVCGEICISCAESCDSLTTEKEMMQECIDSCRKCAASCEEMSKMQ